MEEGHSSGLLKQCHCNLCQGAKWWHKSTEEDTLHTEEDEQMVEDNEVFAEDVEHMVDDDDVVLEDVPPISEALSLEQAISCQIIELQRMWDEAHIPTGLQGQMLERLFGSLEKQPNLHSSGKLDHTGLSLGKLLTLTGPDWKGELGEYDVPCSWSSLKNMYSYLGLVAAQRWRLCTGSKEAPHPPELLNPSLEDVTKDLVFCHVSVCQGVALNSKRDCAFCSEKCPTCKMKRKNILAFEQLPLGKLLGVLVSTKTVCFKLLHSWRNRVRWLGRDVSFVSEKIEENFDGSKFREIQDFFNPETEWEAPVICQNPECRHAYRAFPSKSKILLENWDEVLQRYEFPCSDCSSRICQPKIMMKVFSGT